MFLNHLSVNAKKNTRKNAPIHDDEIIVEHYKARRHAIKDAQKLDAWQVETLQIDCDFELEARQFMIENLIPKGGVTLLSGAGSAGKSLLALQMAYAMTTHSRFFNFATKGAKALYFNAGEDDRIEVKRRVQSMSRLHRLNYCFDFDIVSSRLMLNEPIKQHGSLKPTPAYARLLELSREYDFLIIDNLARYFDGNEIIRAEVTAFMALLEHLSEQASCTILLLAHTSKGDHKTISGSTAFQNCVRTELNLAIDDSDRAKRHLTIAKGNYSAQQLDLCLYWYQGVFVMDSLHCDAVSNMPHTIHEIETEIEKDCLHWIEKAANQGVGVHAFRGGRALYAPDWIVRQKGVRFKAYQYGRALKKLVDRSEIEKVYIRRKTRLKPAIIGLAPKGWV
ncbi:MAG: AAA family ATPase [Pseudomonadota bacterium]